MSQDLLLRRRLAWLWQWQWTVCWSPCLVWPCTGLASWLVVVVLAVVLAVVFVCEQHCIHIASKQSL